MSDDQFLKITKGNFFIFEKGGFNFTFPSEFRFMKEIFIENEDYPSVTERLKPGWKYHTEKTKEDGSRLVKPAEGMSYLVYSSPEKNLITRLPFKWNVTNLSSPILMISRSDDTILLEDGNFVRWSKENEVFESINELPVFEEEDGEFVSFDIYQDDIIVSSNHSIFVYKNEEWERVFFEELLETTGVSIWKDKIGFSTEGDGFYYKNGEIDWVRESVEYFERGRSPSTDGGFSYSTRKEYQLEFLNIIIRDNFLYSATPKGLVILDSMFEGPTEDDNYTPTDDIYYRNDSRWLNPFPDYTSGDDTLPTWNNYSYTENRDDNLIRKRAGVLYYKTGIFEDPLVTIKWHEVDEQIGTLTVMEEPVEEIIGLGDIYTEFGSETKFRFPNRLGLFSFPGSSSELSLGYIENGPVLINGTEVKCIDREDKVPIVKVNIIHIKTKEEDIESVERIKIDRYDLLLRLDKEENSSKFKKLTHTTKGKEATFVFWILEDRKEFFAFGNQDKRFRDVERLARKKGLL